MSLRAGRYSLRSPILYAELLKTCTADAQRATLETGIRQFRDKYVERFPAYLAAQGGIAKRNVVPRKGVTGMQEARSADNATIAFREWVAEAQDELRKSVAGMVAVPSEESRVWRDKIVAGRAREKVAAL